MPWLGRWCTSLRKHAVLSFVCVVILAGAILTAGAVMLGRHLVEHDGRLVGAELSDFVTRNLPAAVFAANGKGEATSYERTIGRIVGLDRIARVILYDGHGTVLWSDDASLIERRFADNSRVAAALAGQLTVTILRPGDRVHEPVMRPTRRMEEIYLPIRYLPQGPVVGVLEVYRDAPALFAVVDRASALVWAFGGGSVLLVCSALVGFAWAWGPMKAPWADAPAPAPLVEDDCDIIYTLDPAGRITSLNPAFETVTGWACADWIGKPLTLLVHSDDAPWASTVHRAVLAGERLSTFTARIRCRGGDTIPGEFIVTPQTEAGRVIGINGAAGDTRERVGAAEHAVRHGDGRPAATENRSDAIVCADGRGRITYVNRTAERMFRYSADEVIGRPLAVLGSPRSRDAVERCVSQILAPGAARVSGTTLVSTGRRKDGAEFALEMTLASWRTWAGGFVIALLRDTTERRLAHAALRRLNEALEDEARRIAHALHDEAGQLIASAHIVLKDSASELPPASAAKLAPITAVLDQIEARLRDLSHELRPTILDDLGLVPALRCLGARVAAATTLAVTVEGETGGRLAPVIETALYRVIQEALANVVRHAQARAACIRVEREGAVIRCSITDDGNGFDVHAVLARRGERGLGLIGIRERMESLGGAVEIDTACGRSTALRVTVPLEE